MTVALLALSIGDNESIAMFVLKRLEGHIILWHAEDMQQVAVLVVVVFHIVSCKLLLVQSAIHLCVVNHSRDLYPSLFKGLVGGEVEA